MAKTLRNFIILTLLRFSISPAFAIENYNLVDQGWTYAERMTYWYTPQGSYLLPYNWFVELPGSQADSLLKNELKNFGFLEMQKDERLNPEALPIGLTVEKEPVENFPALQGKGNWVGVTCAACHVGKVEVSGKSYLLEGAPSQLDMEKFSAAVENSLTRVAGNENLFSNFKAALARRGQHISLEELREVLRDFRSRHERSFVFNHQSVNSGPGRVDAFGIILNEVAGTELGITQNYKTATAPVSLPHMWGAPQLLWIQYNGLSNNAFTRNIGEVLGVYGRVNLDPNSKDYLNTTVRYEKLLTIERLLRKLQAPRWQEIVETLSQEQVAKLSRGREVYMNSCVSCHALPATPSVAAGFGGLFNPVALTPVNELGTDPQYFKNLGQNWGQAATGNLKGSSVLQSLLKQDPQFFDRLKFAGDRIDESTAKRIDGPVRTALMSALSQSATPFGENENGVKILGQTTISLMLKYIEKNGITIGPTEAFNDISGGGGFERQESMGAFKARPLDGIWATGPFLHNGSVRTLKDLLNPPDQREKTFRMGSFKMDADNVGFVSEGHFVFDSTQTANSNAGHTQGTDLSAEDKDALLQFLKTL